MAQRGEGGFALQVAVVSSALGGIASAFALMLLAPPLSKATLLFGPSEVFWIAVFGMCSIVFLLGGNVIKGLLSACRSEEHTSELQSLMRISYAVFCLKKKTKTLKSHIITH